MKGGSALVSGVSPLLLWCDEHRRPPYAAIQIEKTNDSPSERKFEQMRSKCTTAVAMLAAVFAFSAVAVVSASAHEFIASKTGTFKGTGTDTVLFNVGGGLGECSSPSHATGKITSLKSTAIVETVTYKGCNVFGEVVEGMPPVEWEFTAAGTVRLLSKITMPLPLLSCEFVWSPVAKEKGAATYKNSAPVKSIAVEQGSKEMTLKGTGGFCGNEDTKSEWIDNQRFEVEGGTLKWE